MAKISSDGSVAKVAGYTLIGSTAIVLVGLLVIGVLILSLLPLYVPNTSVPGYGDVFTMRGLVLQATYTNIGFNFTGGGILNRGLLADICTQIFRAQNINNFYGCVVTGLTAYGPSNSSDLLLFRKRRNINDAYIYQLANISLLFSSTCANNRALHRWFTTLFRSQNSTCVAQRAAICRQFIATPNPAHYSSLWSPFPTSFTQLVVTNNTGCAAISVTNMSNVAYYNYAGVYYRFNITGAPSASNWMNAGDCLYDSILSQTNLAYLVSSNTGVNSSFCTFTVG